MQKYIKKILLSLTLLALPYSASAVALTNPINIKTPEDLIANIIKFILGITGSIALLLFVYGGFLWMTSAGNSEQVTKGKNVFIWATIGLIVIFSSYAILKEVFKVLN